MIFLGLAIFILGLAAGSFLNCVIYRLEKEKSFLRGRSFCPECKHALRWYDLIPLVSFLILRGKCRYCAKKISLQYPLVEISTGLIFLLIFNFQFTIFNEFSIYNFQTLAAVLYLFIVASFLIIIFVYDLKHYLIPDKILLPAIAVVFLYRLFEFLKFENWSLIENCKLKIENLGSLANPLFAGLGAMIFFLIIFLISWGKWLGFGDVKLAFFMGFFLGYPKILVALFLGFFIGAIIGLGLILLKKKELKSEIPFGPFLITGTFIALFWGEALISWYLSLFNLV